ncbi:hypothetical protein GE09DRAFT_1099514 [Coniochaeta sp. 2T2.1]|nr:hypothetical protein GE09DRAFT_1099514 [Coniochaeta sp. 2T2.1]
MGVRLGLWLCYSLSEGGELIFGSSQKSTNAMERQPWNVRSSAFGNRGQQDGNPWDGKMGRNGSRACECNSHDRDGNREDVQRQVGWQGV